MRAAAAVAGAGEKPLSEHGEDSRGDGMAKNVTQMVPPWVKPAQQVVQAVREHAERPVGLVRAAVGERRAPEVVVDQIP